jgi:hypothetical protein
MDRDSPEKKWSRTFSRAYVWIRRMSLMSLCGVSDLSIIMFDYSNGVWFQEMMQLMTLIVTMVLMI